MPSIDRYLHLDMVAAALPWPFPKHSTALTGEGDRTLVCKWLVELAAGYDVELSTYALAVKLFDVFCARQGTFPRSRAQGLACVVFDMAYKVCPDQVEEEVLFRRLVALADGAVTEDAARDLQGEVMNALHEGYIWPSIIQFLILLATDSPGVYYRQHLFKAVELAVRVIALGSWHAWPDLAVAVACLRKTGPVQELPPWVPVDMTFPAFVVGPTKLTLNDADGEEQNALDWLVRAVDRQFAPFMSTAPKKRKFRH